MSTSFFFESLGRGQGDPSAEAEASLPVLPDEGWRLLLERNRREAIRFAVDRARAIQIAHEEGRGPPLSDSLLPWVRWERMKAEGHPAAQRLGF